MRSRPLLEPVGVEPPPAVQPRTQSRGVPVRSGLRGGVVRRRSPIADDPEHSAQERKDR